MLLIGLGISVSAAVVEKPAAARLQEYNNYIVTFYEVDGVPKEFNKKCREELDLCPEDAPEQIIIFILDMHVRMGQWQFISLKKVKTVSDSNAITRP